MVVFYQNYIRFSSVFLIFQETWKLQGVICKKRFVLFLLSGKQLRARAVAVDPGRGMLAAADQGCVEKTHEAPELDLIPSLPPAVSLSRFPHAPAKP